MSVVIRHGGESHVMRPDRVYRTSVLSPMMNYSPQADVQAVAYAFTQGPPLGTMLQGLGAPTILDRIKAFFSKSQAAINNVKDQIINSMPAAAPAPNNQGPSQVAPQMATQMDMLARLGRGSMMPGVSNAARALTRRRYLTYYKAG